MRKLLVAAMILAWMPNPGPNRLRQGFGGSAEATAKAEGPGLHLIAATGQDRGESTIEAPAGGAFYGLTPQFAISPDGQQIVFVGNAPRGPAMLWLRSLSSSAARPLAGTEQASYPFWSASGQFIGFFAAGKLQKIPAGGGPPSTICDAPNGRGGTWNTSDLIVFSYGITDPLKKVSAAGGSPTAATVLEAGRENSHRWPHFLPDGNHVLFWAGGGSAPPGLKITALDSGQVIVVGPADTNAAYAAGYVFFGSRNVLMAQRFDVASFQKTGDPVRVAEPLSGDAGSSFASLSVAAIGALAFTRGAARPLVLTWFDRAGNVLSRVGEPGQYTNVAVSPDGKRIAVSLTAGTPANRDVWLLDAAIGTPTPVTTDPAVDASPVWSPDSTKVAFSSTRGGPYQIYRRDPASSTDELVFKADVASIATDWSRDGRHIVYTRGTAATGLTLWLMPLSPGGAPREYLATGGAKDNAAFSPNNGFIAYQSTESGRAEVYVLPMERTSSSQPVRISDAGGTQPLWRADGQELFFLAPDGSVMSRAVMPPDPKVRGSIRLMGAARRLFSAPVSLVIRRSYAVSGDGQRVLMPILDDRVKQTITVRPVAMGQ